MDSDIKYSHDEVNINKINQEKKTVSFLRSHTPKPNRLSEKEI